MLRKAAQAFGVPLKFTVICRCIATPDFAFDSFSMRTTCAMHSQFIGSWPELNGKVTNTLIPR